MALLPLFASACSAASDEPTESAPEESVGTTQSELSLLPVRCQRVDFPVSLVDGQPATYNVAGWLCGRGSIQRSTIQVLLHGATYSHVYWDFPYQPERYSYVRAATAAGYATLALDRIGNGASDHPPANDVTVTANASVVHQVIQKLRSGTLNVPSFGRIRGDRVMLVGHSLGSIVSIREAATYHDVDGVILSGFTHTFGPGLSELGATFIPAQLDPRFASAGLPPGYLTTSPGTRGGAYFYYSPTTDPAVVPIDEANKETNTTGEAIDFASSIALSPQIDVPVFVAVGDRDRVFCASPTCNESGTTEAEAQYYSPAAHVKVVAVPAQGHILNLHKQAPVWFGLAAAWSALYVGSDTRFPAPLGH